jgi:hypothetical protein
MGDDGRSKEKDKLRGNNFVDQISKQYRLGTLGRSAVSYAYVKFFWLVAL